MLDYVVTGPLGTLTPRSSFPDYSSADSEIENVREITHSIPSTPKSPVDTLSEYAGRTQKPSAPTTTAVPSDKRAVGETGKVGGVENDMLKLAARTVSISLAQLCSQVSKLSLRSVNEIAFVKENVMSDIYVFYLKTRVRF